jgi:hypothetical protein
VSRRPTGAGDREGARWLRDGDDNEECRGATTQHGRGVAATSLAIEELGGGVGGKAAGRTRGGRLPMKEYEAEGEAELEAGHRRKEGDDDWGSRSPAIASRVPIYVNM